MTTLANVDTMGCLPQCYKYQPKKILAITIDDVKAAKIKSASSQESRRRRNGIRDHTMI